MSKNKVDWNQWLSDKETANNERMKEKMSQQGLKPYLTLEQGENTFTLLPEVPTPKVSNWGTDQEVFKVQKKGAKSY